MVIEITTVAIHIINQIRELIKLSDSEKQEEKTEVKNALKAIYAASIETKSYITKRKNGAKRDTKVESALSKLWAEAAIESRDISREWAEILEMKSQYWTEPENWTEEQIQEAGIDIDEVTEKARDLLLTY